MRTMTIEEYINNPGGVGSSVIPNRELVRNDYIQRFDKLYAEKKHLFTSSIYKDGNDYFVHVVIPSEGKDRENTYDVVVKFMSSDDVENSSTVKNYNIQLFSNSQSFIYTYTYVYDKEKLLVLELKDKFNSETFQAPTTRNPYESISYEKSTFMAIQYILNNPTLLNKDNLNKGESINRLKTRVRHMDRIKIEQGKEKARLSEISKAEEIASAKKSKLKASASTSKTTPKRGINRVLPSRGSSKTKPKSKVGPTVRSRKPKK